jgi:transcriptional regulator with XRE-family HTH domain
VFVLDKQFDQRQKQINRLQENLSSIRKIAGWTAEVLGNKIGVTKQTISNLENNKTPMNFTQYIAIRSVLDAEIEQNKENKVLPQVIAILLDSDNELDDDEYEEIQKSVETVSAVASGGIKGAALLSALTALSPVVIGLLSSVKISDWKKLLK